MMLKTVMIFNAIVGIIFGVLFVIVPTQVLSMYAVGVVEPQIIYTARLFGAALIGIGLLAWTARNAADSEARKAIILALFVAPCIGFIVALIAQLNNVVNALGWLNVVIYILLSLGFGYLQFSKTTSTD